jgi:hypothetical protein
MLPDEAGRPFKRTGWEVAISADEITALIGGDYAIQKCFYFELGGVDHIVIFCDVALLLYADGELSLLSRDSSCCASYERAFFFEGGGDAGFYVFVGLKMFVFTGQQETYGGITSRFFHEVEPYIPVVAFACDPNGYGETGEDINMLTRFRIIQYTCDGHYDDEQTIVGTTVFTVPDGFKSSTLKVEVRNEDTGNWEEAETTSYIAENGNISFSEPPLEVISGEDNLRVTYEPDGQGASATEKTITTDSRMISVTRTKHEMRRKLSNGTIQPWYVQGYSYSFGSTDFNVANVKTNPLTHERYITFQCRDSSNSSWTTFSNQLYEDSFDSYKTTINIKGKIALYNSSVGSETSKYTKTTETSAWKTVTYSGGVKYQEQTRTTKETKYYRIRVVYTSYVYTGGTAGESESKTAFSQCSRVLVFGSGVINQIFLTSSPYTNYNTRVWYSGATNPKYFPELNYFEAGATDKPIMGLIKVGEYLGVVKQGDNIDTAVYLAYPTTFSEDPVYAVKQNIGGIGAISNGAFNILDEEPLFFSKDGVMAIEVSAQDVDRQLRNRSYYVNKKLCSEDNPSRAISFVYDGMYWIALNGHCYVLDGNQKVAWENTRTNLQYEAYYLENIPAQCFCRFHDELWFTDFNGNVCRFYTDADEKKYHDDYHVDGAKYVVNYAPIDGFYPVTSLDDTVAVGDFIRHGDTWYTVAEIGTDSVRVDEGVAIDAVWSTIADDDGSVHYFKNLQKKGVVVSLMPSSDSGVDVYVKADSNAPVLVGTTDAKDYELPFDFYLRKKVKKYKRLQFICRNNVVDDSFGLDQIIKSYTIGNYSKNRGNG